MKFNRLLEDHERNVMKMIGRFMLHFQQELIERGCDAVIVDEDIVEIKRPGFPQASTVKIAATEDGKAPLIYVHTKFSSKIYKTMDEFFKAQGI